ncbi:MAG: hypothetical protein ACYCZA_07980 [Thiobacillus sp.]
MNELTPDQRHSLLQSAIQAPSADNRHPIHFQLGDQCIRVLHTRTEWGERGYKRILDLLSLGALAENLSIAASRFDMGTDIALLPDPDRPELVLQIRLLPGAVQADPLWQAIPLRHTNRQIRFRGPLLNKDEQAQLADAIRPQPACQLHWLDTAPARKHALALMRRAETERFHNPLLHAELFSAIRFDVGWRSPCEAGLPPGALGVEPPLRGLFTLLRHWPVMRMANRVGAHHLLGWRSCDLPCRLAPHLGVLTVKNTDTASVFAAGRAFQRLWLTATRQGRVLQPMPASALYALEGAVDEGIPLGLQHALAAGWRAHLGGDIPLMLFRMGRASPPLITAGRPQPDVDREHEPPV